MLPFEIIVPIELAPESTYLGYEHTSRQYSLLLAFGFRSSSFATLYYLLHDETQYVRVQLRLHGIFDVTSTSVNLADTNGGAVVDVERRTHKQSSLALTLSQLRDDQGYSNPTEHPQYMIHICLSTVVPGYLPHFQHRGTRSEEKRSRWVLPSRNPNPPPSISA